MEMSDADKMLEWKNYSETRDFSIVSKLRIRKKDHYNWLKKNLRYFQIIGNMYGAIRIQNNEISIWIDREHRKKGIATFVLNQIAEPGQTAKIADGNIASMRSFINAGFKPVSYKSGCYIFKI